MMKCSVSHVSALTSMDFPSKNLIYPFIVYFIFLILFHLLPFLNSLVPIILNILVFTSSKTSAIFTISTFQRQPNLHRFLLSG